MRLPDIEPNTHSPQDWHKRLSSSYIYGHNGLVSTPKVLHIKAISEISGTSEQDYEAALVVYKDAEGNTQQCPASRLHVEAFRPEPGIYNLQQFPVSVTHLPFRQWHFGCTSESISIKRLSGQHWNLATHLYENLFNPTYPTLGDAVELLKAKKKKHIAVSPYVSLLASGAKTDRFVILYKFVPIASINNGMWFPSPAARPLEKIALEYKDVLMDLIKT